MFFGESCMFFGSRPIYQADILYAWQKAIDLKISILPKDDFDSDASQDNSMMSKEKR